MTETTSPVTFRSAEPAAPVATPTGSKPSSSPTARPAASDTSDAPPSLYNEVNKQPFAVKHLDIGLYFDDPDFKDVHEQAKELDAYVLKQLKAQGLKDDASSYKEVVEAIYKQIGKSPNEDPTKALKRLSVAAKAIERLESAKLPPILSAQSLSPTEFEDIQK